VKGNGKVIAGGTDLLVNMKKGTVKPAFLVSLKKVEGLREIAGKNGGLSVGSHVTVSEIAGSDRVISSFRYWPGPRPVSALRSSGTAPPSGEIS
jgi:carbon-monoxide dehydrogenase medium subunit